MCPLVQEDERSRLQPPGIQYAASPGEKEVKQHIYAPVKLLVKNLKSCSYEL
jgi:hypothetical protein